MSKPWPRIEIRIYGDRERVGHGHFRAQVAFFPGDRLLPNIQITSPINVDRRRLEVFPGYVRLGLEHELSKTNRIM